MNTEPPLWLRRLIVALFGGLMSACAVYVVLNVPGSWMRALLTVAVVTPLAWRSGLIEATDDGRLIFGRSPSIAARFLGVALLVPFAVLVVAVLGGFWLGLPLLIAGVGWLLYGMLKHRAAAAISERVARDAAGRAAAPAAEIANATRAHSAEPPSFPLSLEILEPDALPEPSAATAERLDENARRALLVRRVRYRGLVALIAAQIALALAFWLSGPAPFATASGHDGVLPTSPRLPWVLAVIVAFSGAIISGMLLFLVPENEKPRESKFRALLDWISGSERSYDPHPDDPLFEAVAGASSFGAAFWRWSHAAQSLQPWSLLALTALWMAVALLSAPLYFARAGGLAGTVFSAISLVVPVAYVFWTRLALRRVERAHPYRQPFRLLMLRVFGVPNQLTGVFEFQDLAALTQPWLGVGLVQRLDGPDSTGQRAGDVLNLLTGRIERSLVTDDAELQSAFDGFGTAADRNLRFPVNSAQCTDVTWKPAISRMLNSADVVLMDLSNLTRGRLGCTYELGKLIDEVPLSRVILLANSRTDIGWLRELLDEASTRMSAGSPNRGMAQPLRVVKTGIPADFAETNEPEFRSQHSISPYRLSALLYDAAVATGATAPAEADVRWTRATWLRRSPGLRLAIDEEFALLIIGIASWTQLVLTA